MTDALATEPAGQARDGAALLRDAIGVLTKAGRHGQELPDLTPGGDQQPQRPRTQPTDWAEFVTLAVAGAAANLGGVEEALRGRPGSWEAETVRRMLESTVGDDPNALLHHRTEPLQLVLRPIDVLAALRYDAVYDESKRILRAEQARHVWSYRLTLDRRWRPLDGHAPAHDAPADDWLRPGAIKHVPRTERDEDAFDTLLDLEGEVENLRYDADPAALGEALRATAEATAAQLGLDVEISIDLDDGVASHTTDEFYGPVEELVEAINTTTALPWSGLSVTDYPRTPQEIVDLERTAGRLPHQRLVPGAAVRP